MPKTCCELTPDSRTWKRGSFLSFVERRRRTRPSTGVDSADGEKEISKCSPVAFSAGGFCTCRKGKQNMNTHAKITPEKIFLTDILRTPLQGRRLGNNNSRQLRQITMSFENWWKVTPTLIALVSSAFCSSHISIPPKIKSARKTAPSEDSSAYWSQFQSWSGYLSSD